MAILPLRVTTKTLNSCIVSVLILGWVSVVNFWKILLLLHWKVSRSGEAIWIQITLWIETIKQIILTTRFDCRILCIEPNLTILIGNERWGFHLSIDAKIIAKDWIDAILQANWIEIYKIQIDIVITEWYYNYYMFWNVLLLLHDHDIQIIQKKKKNIEMKENNQIKQISCGLDCLRVCFVFGLFDFFLFFFHRCTSVVHIF